MKKISVFLMLMCFATSVLGYNSSTVDPKQHLDYKDIPSQWIDVVIKTINQEKGDFWSSEGPYAIFFIFAVLLIILYKKTFGK
jgi:hypothetical protein